VQCDLSYELAHKQRGRQLVIRSQQPHIRRQRSARAYLKYEAQRLQVQVKTTDFQSSKKEQNYVNKRHKDIFVHQNFFEKKKAAMRVK
jgi:hypothetical protein